VGTVTDFKEFMKLYIGLPHPPSMSYTVVQCLQDQIYSSLRFLNCGEPLDVMFILVVQKDIK